MTEFDLTRLSLPELADLKRSVDDQIYRAVSRRRDEGATWRQIGEELRVSAQEAHRRYRTPSYGLTSDGARTAAYLRDREAPQ